MPSPEIAVEELNNFIREKEREFKSCFQIFGKIKIRLAYLDHTYLSWDGDRLKAGPVLLCEVPLLEHTDLYLKAKIATHITHLEEHLYEKQVETAARVLDLLAPTPRHPVPNNLKT